MLVLRLASSMVEHSGLSSDRSSSKGVDGIELSYALADLKAMI